MKLAYKTLEIWQLAMKLVEITHLIRKQFPQEERYSLWSQLISAVESTPLLIAEGYGRKTPPDRAHFMDQAIASNLEAKTAYQISVKKEYVTRSQFEKLISPLIEKIHFKTIGFKKYLLKQKTSKRGDQPTQPKGADHPSPPRHHSVPITRLHRVKRFKGFTLIEVLVVVGTLGIIAIMGSRMFFSILKSSAKTRALAEVKQNGNYALGVMERMIRNAREIINNTESPSRRCELSMRRLKIKNPDGESTEFACLDWGTTNGRITIGSGSPPVDERLTNNKVKVNSCSFNCEPGTEGVEPDKATIIFRLSQAETNVRPEEQAMVDFQTTVTLRNY